MSKEHLTDRFIERVKLPNAGTEAEYYDQAYPGLSIRVSYGGAKTFHDIYRVEGKRKRVTIGRWPRISLDQARDEWRRHREALKRGDAPDATKTEAASTGLFESVVREWMEKEQSKHRPKTVYNLERVIKTCLLPVWTGKAVKNITRSDVVALLDGIIERGSKAQAWKVHGDIRAFFSWCLDREYITVDPVAGMKRMGVNKARDRVLTDAELREVYRAASRIGPAGTAVMILALTGARREEIGALKWAEVDLTNGAIKLSSDRTKTGNGHCKPLSTVALDILKAIPRTDSPYVFGERGVRDWTGPKDKLDALSGVSDWRIHDLRRTLSTRLNEMGVEPHVVEAILDHTVKGVAGVYNKATYEKMKREALQKWAKHIMTLVM